MPRLLRTIYLTLVLVATLVSPAVSSAQTGEPDHQESVVTPAAPDLSAERPVPFKQLVPNILTDQKRIFSYPARLAKGKDWVATIAVAGATAALVAFDPTEGAYFHKTQTFHDYNKVFSGYGTEAATVAVPAAFYLIGWGIEDPKMQRTGLLAGEALVDAEILATVLKVATRRLGPSQIPVGGDYSHTWYQEKGPIWRHTGSFPSGHTISAFAVATIVARRYGNHRWVPYAAYGMAALVGFSRLTESAHFLSDVFFGGALGYTVSRFAVLPE